METDSTRGGDVEGDYCLDSILRVPFSQSEEASGSDEERVVRERKRTAQKRKRSVSQRTQQTDHQDPMAQQSLEGLVHAVDDLRSLLLVPIDQVLHVCGQCTFEVLAGTAQVGGIKVRREIQSARLFSYPWTNYVLTITSRTSADEAKLESSAEGLDIPDRLQKAKGALLLITSLDLDSTAAHSESLAPLSLLTVVRGFSIVVEDVSMPPAFCLWQEWSELLEAVNNVSSVNPVKILLAGNRGCGKSTMARCLVNHLLNNHGAMQYVEADAGQPLRVMPGVVALMEIDSQEFGSDISSVRYSDAEVVHANFLGVTSAAGNPDAYTECLQSLINGARQKSDPIVVNTHGWFRGQGLEFTKRLLALLDADLVVHVEKPSDDVSTKRGKQRQDASIFDERINVVNITSVVSSAAVRSGRQLREDRLRVYFHPRDPVYSIPWHALQLHFVDAEIDRSHELIALNGSVVALCTSRGQRGLPPHRWKYVGLGIVRAVSTRQRLYFIATPVGRDVLVSQNVDAAISSRFVQMPAQSMSTYASTDSTELPYTTSDAVALMSVSMQGRGNLKRSRLSERNYSRRTAGPRG